LDHLEEVGKAPDTKVGPSDIRVGAAMGESPSPTGREVGVKKWALNFNIFSLTLCPSPDGRGK